MLAVGGGGRIMGEDGLSSRGEGQAEHAKIATAQIRADISSFLVDHILETTNVLISWLTNDVIVGFVGKYSTFLLDGVEVMMGSCVVCEDDAQWGIWWGS